MNHRASAMGMAAAFLAATMVSSCGRSPALEAPAEGSPSPAATAPDAAAATPTAALAVALEGDVEAVSEIEYQARGPEIRCSAFLIENGEAAPIAGIVDWRVLPESAGVFSIGATGVFFIPNGAGRVEILARHQAGERTIESPHLVLVVAEAG